MPDVPSDAIELILICLACEGELRALVGAVRARSRPLAWICPYCGVTQHTDCGGPLYGIGKR